MLHCVCLNKVLPPQSGLKVKKIYYFLLTAEWNSGLHLTVCGSLKKIPNRFNCVKTGGGLTWRRNSFSY